ncbi:cytochrome C family protein [Cooperia oncophora]
MLSTRWPPRQVPLLIECKSGAVPRFTYSDANKNKEVVWSRETLFVYLVIRRKYIPGTKMVFAGIKKPGERADLIKYIEVEGASHQLMKKK